MNTVKSNLFALCLAFFVATTIVAGNQLTYTAIEKLPVTDTLLYAGLHPNAFNVKMISHRFEDGKGTILFNGELTTIGSRAFYACDGLTSIDIPGSVRTIGSEAFFFCSRLQTVSFGLGINTIESNAFCWCENLTSITLPITLYTLGDEAFSLCGLTELKIPLAVTAIGTDAFGFCSQLTSVTTQWGKESLLPTMGEDVFVNIAGGEGPQNATLHIPSSTHHIYDYADQWMDFGTINDDYDPSSALSSVSGEAVTPIKVLQDGHIYIRRNGRLYPMFY